MEGSPHSVDSSQGQQKDVYLFSRPWDKKIFFYGHMSTDNPSRIWRNIWHLHHYSQNQRCEKYCIFIWRLLRRWLVWYLLKRMKVEFNGRFITPARCFIILKYDIQEWKRWSTLYHIITTTLSVLLSTSNNHLDRSAIEGDSISIWYFRSNDEMDKKTQ